MEQTAALSNPAAAEALEIGRPPRSPSALSLTLDDAIAISLDRNANLVSLRSSEPAAQAAYRTAEVYPWNPYVQIEVLPYSREPGGHQGATTNYVLLMQTLDLAHQRKHREANAAAAWSQVRWNVVQAELATAAQTERLYFTALYLRDVRDLQQTTARLTVSLGAIVERRFNAALATPAENTMAQVAIRQTRLQAALAEANYQTALLALRRQLCLGGDESIMLAGSLEHFAWSPISSSYDAAAEIPEGDRPECSLAAEMASVRPDVMAAVAGVEAARANANLARANRIPSPQAGPFYERDDAGVVFAGLRAQSNLPIWDTGKALVDQRDAEVRQRIVTLEELRTQAAIEAETAIERYERARTLSASSDSAPSQAVPGEMLRLNDLFAAGQATILNVFAAQTSLLQERRSHFDLLNELAQAAADVSLAAGLPPARLITASPQDLPAPELLPSP